MRSMLAFTEGFFLSGSNLHNSVVESWTVANPFLFLLVLASSLDRVSLHNSVLESTDLALSVARNLQCFFPFTLGLALGCSSARGGLSKLSFT